MTDLFLGGPCNPTTWRRDIAIPALEAAGVTYYNPQVEDWHPELVQIEAQAKAEARGLLFVLSGQTRGVATLIEATEAICTGRLVWLVIEDIPDGQVIDGHAVTERELADLNNARQYLVDVTRRYQWRARTICSSVEDAVKSIVEWFTTMPPSYMARSARR